MRVLVIEDNPQVARDVQRALEEQQIEVEVATEGSRGEEKAASDGYDMVILDLMLPDRDGIDICQTLRRHGVKTPILMLSSLGSTEHKIKGLRAGADDYVTKPFAPGELAARVEAIARRTQGEDNAHLSFNGLEIDLLRRQVTRNGTPIRLTTKEFELLEYFMRHPHRVLSKMQLGTRVWDVDYEEDSNVIEVYVSRLRKKIDAPFGDPLLHTVIGAGYIFSNEPPAA